jgi:predicted ATP-grasp superfamily ATP-dependent carboligase
MRVLLLCAPAFGLAYRVLRCASAAGAEVHVLGDSGSNRLALSRQCKKVVRTIHGISGTCNEGLAAEIDWYAREAGIDRVLPGGDAASTRALAALKHLLEVPCFPVPGIEQFDLLNNKWEFTKLCGELGLACPSTRLFINAAALGREVEVGSIAFPIMVKALSLAGGIGTFKFDADDASSRVRQIRFCPVLVQEFIAGRDIGASIFCRGGEVLVFAGFYRDSSVLRTYEDVQIQADLAKIARHLALDGVFNFDMRRAEDGRVYYLECNPRFFFNMPWLMVAGINFVGLGLADGDDVPAVLPGGIELKFPRGIVRSLPRPWALTGCDLRMIEYMLADPAALLIDRFGQR